MMKEPDEKKFLCDDGTGRRAVFYGTKDVKRLADLLLKGESFVIWQ